MKTCKHKYIKGSETTVQTNDYHRTKMMIFCEKCGDIKLEII